MNDPAQQRAVGVEMNGQVWDGARWVPRATPTAGSFGAQAGYPARGFPANPLPSGGGFLDPYYAYGLTKRASDDIHFIARFTKIMIIIWLVLVLPTAVLLLLTVGGLVARLGSMVYFPR